ncbi:MAG: pseudouridine-5'-phosphate glycosidase [Gemmatimonadetes bacterium]|nr:pseudouridine-5'-phosphate glycosidase [Gemmatimonadota bacterium]
MAWDTEAAAARWSGRPLVALESSVFAQGLRQPVNRAAHRRMCDAVRAAGAVPAVTGVVGGRPSVGLDDETLERFFAGAPQKMSARDMPWAVAQGLDGATTVAASLVIAALAGVEVFATGGIGGVHRDAPFDESADLLELARCSVVTVCAGAKAILDLPATLERLETHGVTVVGYRTTEFPGFFTAKTGLPLTAVAHTPADIARTFLAGRALGRPGALLVVQPPPAGEALAAAVVATAVDAVLRSAAAAGIRGTAVTPFLLAAVERATEGGSVRANIGLLESNARLAGEIAVAIAEERGTD